MTSQRSSNRTLALAMVVVSMLYAAALAVMASLSMSGVGVVAIIGGCLVGIGWVVVAMGTDRLSGRKSDG